MNLHAAVAAETEWMVALLERLVAAPTTLGNEEAGQVWMARLLGHFHRAVWLAPVPQNHWGYTQSIGLVRHLMGNRMFPLTLEGLDAAMRELVR